MIRLRGCRLRSPAGHRIRNCIQSSLDTSLANIRLLGLYWDAPVLLSSVASNVSITGRRLRALTRASYRASLAYLVCEAI